MSPSSFGVVEHSRSSKLLLLCDHASCAVPASMHHLGLDLDISRSHYGWDIGALDAAQLISQQLKAPLVFTRCSRLVIDCNRPLTHHELIRTEIEGAVIPGNHRLRDRDIRKRIRSYFLPYHRAASAHLRGQLASEQGVLTAAVHSFSPVLGGIMRPWHIGITYLNRSPFIDYLIDVLEGKHNLIVGDNLPYPVTLEGDFTLPNHCSGPRTPSVLIEIRQDLLQHKDSRDEFSHLIGDALAGTLNQADRRGWWKS